MASIHNRAQVLIALLVLPLSAQSQSCYWRSDNSITVETEGWFACNNTETSAGGSQLCCLSGASCGQDSICYTPSSGGGSGWFVGGCTDPTYQDPVCRSSCTGDFQTWIQYNYTSQLWHCCGSDGCTGTPTNETFQAVPPASWSAVPSTAIPFADAQATGKVPTYVTVTPTPSGGSIGDNFGTGAIAAVAVLAVLLGLALIAAVAFFILWRKRSHLKNSGAQEAFAGQQKQGEQHSQFQHKSYGGQSGPYYQPVMQHHAELDGERNASELDGYEQKGPAQHTEYNPAKH